MYRLSPNELRLHRCAALQTLLTDGKYISREAQYDFNNEHTRAVEHFALLCIRIGLVRQAAASQDLLAVSGLRATNSITTERLEAAPLPAARPKAPAPKPAAPAPQPTAAPEPSYQTSSGRLNSAKKKVLKAVIDKVWKADTFGVFKLPVTKRIAPDYYDIIQQPMDLKTVRLNLDKGCYDDEHAFKHVRAASAVKHFFTFSFCPRQLRA